MKKRPMVLAGLSVVLLAALAWMLRESDPTESRKLRVTKSSTRSADAALEDSIESTRRERRASAPASRLDSSLTRHEAGQLVDFILPEVKGKDVTIQQALALLKEAYQDACYLSREKALDLKFSVKDDPGYTISFILKGKSLTSCLDYLAALAGLEVKQTEGNFELTAIAGEDKARELILQISLGFEARMRGLCGVNPNDGREDIETLMRNAGIIREAGTTIKIGPNGYWSVNGPAADRKRIMSAYVLAIEPPNQFKFTTSTVTTTEPLDLKTGNLSPSELATFMRELVSRAGTELTSEPSVTARDGQSATMEIINEKGPNDWTGIRHELNGSYTGLKLTGSDKSESRPESTEDTARLSENQYALYPGETDVQLVSSKNGKHTYRLLTVAPIDATGRPIPNGRSTAEEDTVYTDPDAPAGTTPQPAINGAHPTASQVPGKAGFVFSPFNNKVIDVAGLPSGTLVADPTYPLEENKRFRVP
jgi:hypothetical protein